LAIAAALLIYMYKSVVEKMFEGANMLLGRCPPAGIVAHQELLNYLLNQETADKVSMTTTQSIIHNSKNAIVCISRLGIIDSVNLGVTQMFGFATEQLLGQSFMVMVATEKRMEVQNRLEMMRRHECPRQCKERYELLKNTDDSLTCMLTFLGMTGSDSRTIESFVVIIDDISVLLQQQNEAEYAKRQSEKLLYEILPRDIVNRINQGEKDITFVVPSGTILFIDIQKFSAYAATLTPHEIMGNLSLIFGAFDDLLPKYPLITKIKLIGDAYMCGAGLFNTGEDPRHHAEETIRFALEALMALEELNVKLTASLSLRIGVNTGGPIIAGVLGTDKPAFDVIGDPINIAARLQSTCPAGRVQISEDTYNLVKDGDFRIEPRGDVFLKGKGKRPAFLVILASPFPFARSGNLSGSH
jgi:PAS domain S-box-containing protein